MNVWLMHPGRDFVPPAEVPRQVRFRDPDSGPAHELSTCERLLWDDLELDTLAGAMANDDRYLFDVARRALLTSPANDAETIAFRQQILDDCLRNPGVVRELYAIVEETIEVKKKYYFGVLTRYPAGILRGAVELMRVLMGMLARMRDLARTHAAGFESKGFTDLLSMLQREFDDTFAASVDRHLKELRFRGGLLLSARLGESGEGTDYVLRRDGGRPKSWLARLVHRGSRAYSFRLHERDEAGARILSELYDRGINQVANALAQSTEHVLGFFLLLRVELAFYVGCLNLHDRLSALGVRTGFPDPEPRGTRGLRFEDLRDPCLALKLGRAPAANDADANGRDLVIVTGANQGGKSSFLRSVGIAQLMMQSGMFVAAGSFSAGLGASVFTHYKREEDATMRGGKLDEELARMNEIAMAVRPASLVLFNESFASTNEREGSEIARQVTRALLEARVQVIFVTHLYDFAHGIYAARGEGTLFLRANREADGSRTFRLVEAEPLETSYGEDLYRDVFGVPESRELA